MKNLHCLLLFCLSGSLSGKVYLSPTDKLTLSDDYDTVRFRTKPSPAPGFAFWEVTGVVNGTGRKFTGHVAQLSDGLPGTYSYQLPAKGCSQCSYTSATARLHNCTYATNAGFFSLTSEGCIGNLIIQGTVLQLPATYRANFGLSNDSFVVGYLANSSLADLGLQELVSGAGWIVRRGKSYVNESMRQEKINYDFVLLKAPRTAIGVHKNGSLYLVQVDGIEDDGVGVDLYELADILLDMRLYQAVNLDGGGSSVSVYMGHVISQPTCMDMPFICERAVTTITCVRPSHHAEERLPQLGGGRGEVCGPVLLRAR